MSKYNLIKRFASSNAQQSSQSSWLDQCSSILQKNDYGNYLCSLLQPNLAARQAFTVLAAFNVETALVGQGEAKTELPGKIRMQFWKDTVESAFQGKPVQGLAVSEGLCRVMDGGVRWNKAWFTRILNERTKNLGIEQYSTLNQLENYAEHTQSALLYLYLEALFSLDGSIGQGSAKAHVDADHVASHLGKATGLAITLRSLPYQIRSRKLLGLPGDVCAKAGVVAESIFRMGPHLSPGVMTKESSIPELAKVQETSEKFRDAVFQVASQAHAHLGLAMDLIGGKPDGHSTSALDGEERKIAIPAFYSIITTKDILDVLEQVNFDVWDARVHQRDWKMAASLTWRARKLRKSYTF